MFQAEIIDKQIFGLDGRNPVYHLYIKINDCFGNIKIFTLSVSEDEYLNFKINQMFELKKEQ